MIVVGIAALDQHKAHRDEHAPRRHARTPERNDNMSMSEAEREAFLAQTFPTPLGVIATLRRDGSPHAIPVWFRWDSGVVTLWTTDTRVWVRNLLRDPRVSFTVQTFDAPYPAVMIRGRATVATADDAATVEEARAIARRYVAPEDVEDYVARWSDLRTIVTIVADRTVSWSAGG
ncbi:TIGR03618 family F420-dependent PPOX class oxidoreductase [Streptomyces sp. NPDC101175]|uniref:TIGR03618 family F420-dependent PPOX class oxidoreductase n=1 Tax=Streptomyces sp. NPDC101175 TaxID=3366123 RepID=UPI0038367E52